MTDESKPSCAMCRAFEPDGEYCAHDPPDAVAWPNVAPMSICYQFVSLDDHPWNETVRDPKYLPTAPADDPNEWTDARKAEWLKTSCFGRVPPWEGK